MNQSAYNNPLSSKMNRSVSISIITYQDCHLPNLLKILSTVADNVFLISIVWTNRSLHFLKSPKNVVVQQIFHKNDQNPTFRLVNDILTQFNVALDVIQRSKHCDVFLFFIGGEHLVLPMFFLKILRKKIIMMPGGDAIKISELKKDPLSKQLSLLINICFRLSDVLLLYSPHLLNANGYNVHKRKVFLGHEHFLDFDTFKINKPCSRRPKNLGFIGRLSIEKGVYTILKVFSILMKKDCSYTLTIVGNGPLYSDLVKYVEEKGMVNSVKILGQIDHDEVATILNDIKLLILPSLSEGLPNVLLEAMACGTPVLATPVGAICDVIQESKTGFLINSNSPEHIADRINAIINRPDLIEKVSDNAYAYVRENFTFEITSENFRKLLYCCHK